MSKKDSENENLELTPQYGSAIDTKVQRFKLGTDFHQNGNLDTAEKIYRDLIKDDPGHFQALHLLGVVMIQTKRIENGIDLINRALSLRPDFPEALNNRGNAFKELDCFEEALQSYDKALALRPDYPDALYNRGVALSACKHLDEALDSYNKALVISPDYAAAWYSRGNTLRILNRLDEALDSFDRALAIKPFYAEALNNRGNTLKELKRIEESLESFDRALASKRDYPEALYNRGTALFELSRFDEAIKSYDKVLAIRPNYAEAFYSRGNALKELNRLNDALDSFDKALAIRPYYVEALNNRAIVLRGLGRINEALKSYERAIILKPDFAQALNNRGKVLKDIERYDDALNSFDKALSIRPDYAEALFNRSEVLRELKRFEDALVSFDRALALNPDYEFLNGIWLHLRMQSSYWSDFGDAVRKCRESIFNKKIIAPPFSILAVQDDPQLQAEAAFLYIKSENFDLPIVTFIENTGSRERIRLGYFSADFFSHATAVLMAEMFELHDRNKFEIIAFSFGPAIKDQMRQRLEAVFDQFIDVRLQSDQEIAELARRLEIDIAIDLKGYTRDCRPRIFANRCAPVQVNYIGYPGTMSADFIDYIIADRILIPVDSQKFYSEKVVYLPNSYQVNDSKRAISERKFTRIELGLPENAFVFCCFNNSYKILPSMFDSWMRILNSVPGSVLWLLDDNPTSSGNLRREAANRGVSPDRLVFGKRMPLAEHLSRHRCADLFLDTLPCNAHTTASDALWAGLPVLTHIGKSFAARFAASLLNAIGMSELITTTTEEYEARAIHLATHQTEMNSLKQKLSDNRLSSKLFDTRSYVNGLESAYIAMHERSQAGLKPDHIYVNDIH